MSQQDFPYFEANLFYTKNQHPKKDDSCVAEEDYGKYTSGPNISDLAKNSDIDPVALSTLENSY